MSPLTRRRFLAASAVAAALPNLALERAGTPRRAAPSPLPEPAGETSYEMVWQVSVEEEARDGLLNVSEWRTVGSGASFVASPELIGRQLRATARSV